MRTLLLSLILFLHSAVLTRAQEDSSSYHPPLGIDLKLAGNFGELRPRHFHTGLDFKTWGQRGLRIRSIEEGHVSRIKIQEGGYGKALYIEHPDGNTSVYAHLERFAPPIEKFLRKVQYAHERGPIDLYPGEGLLPVKRGEVVAWSGNSGSSSAPHLHFEIRNSASEKPIDPLLFDFDIFDRRAPNFHGIKLNWEDQDGRQKEKVLPTRRIAPASYRPSTGGLIRIGSSKRMRLAVRVTDRATGTHNPLGVRLLELYIDGKKRYSARFDTLDFSKSAYIDAHIDHPYLHEEGRTYHRCHVLPHNELPIYGEERSSSFRPTPDSTHQVRIVATDRAGNRSTLRFALRSRPSEQEEEPPGKRAEDLIVCKWDKGLHYRRNGLEMSFEPRTLYQDHKLIISSDSIADKGELSPDHKVHDAAVPLHKPFIARIALDTTPPGSSKKLFIVSADDKWGTKAYKADLERGWAVGKVKRFGELSVRVDSTAPEIRPVRTRERIPSSGDLRFRFHVSDDMSGIDSYEAYIGGKWRVPYHDAKNSIIHVEVSDSLSPLKPGKKQFILNVEDRAGNQRSFIKKVRVE